MKRNKSNIIIFIIIFIILFLGNEYISRKNYDGSAWDVYENLPDNSLDLLFIGNSHNYTSFDPEIVNQAFELNSFSLGSPNATLPLIYFQLNKAFKTQTPKYVILESYVFDAIEDKNLYNHYLHRSNFDFDDLKLLYNLFDPTLYYYYFVSTTFHEVYWKEPYSYIPDIKSIFSDDSTDFLGFYSRNIMIARNVYEKMSLTEGTLPKHDITENNVYNDYLEKIIELCKENQSTLVIVSSPVVTDYRYNQKIFLFDLEKLTSDYGIKYINLNDEKFSLSWMNYYNDGHLSLMGAVNSTVEFVKRFSSDFDIQYNKEFISNFSDYHYKNYSATINNGHLIINLVPFNEDSINQLLYKWEINYAENQYSVETTKPEVIIDIHDKQLSDKVTINVEINSLGIDYPLDLTFNIPLSFSDIVE